MWIKQAHLHMQELINVIEKKSSLEMNWFNRCKEYVKELKNWKAKLYIVVDKGKIVSVHANCPVDIEEFNIDDRQMAAKINPDEDFDEFVEDWQKVIDELSEKGFIKKIF
jgi:hypothetical protein